MSLFRSPGLAAVLGVALGTALWTTSCGPGSPAGAERTAIREVVAVASAPAEFIASLHLEARAVERLGGDAEALGWSPSDADLKALVTARRVLLMGTELEPWAQRAGLPPSRTITLGDGLSAEALITTATVSHTHGKGAAHSHGGAVPTTWTDPALLRGMVHGAGELLAGILPVADEPSAASAAVERQVAFQAELASYEAALEELKTALDGRRLFAVAHGLEYIARNVEAPLLVTLLEIEASGARNDHAASQLEEAAAAPGHARVLIWPGPIDAAFAGVARESLGLESVRVDLGLGGPGRTLLKRLTASVQALAAAVPSR